MTGVSGPKVAVVHDWLLDYAGSERVLREILETFPQASLFTLIDRPDRELRNAIPRRATATSFLQYLPFPKRLIRYSVPVMPLAVARLDLSEYPLVISSSHAVAKGVITTPRQLHLSYVHTPMRYAWDMRDEYLRAAGLESGPLSWAARFALERLRRWDIRSAAGVRTFLANSTHVANRIRNAYGREAEVLPPPIDTAYFTPGERKGDFYLTVSRLEAYKRIDLLVRAFGCMPDHRLTVIGDGPEMRRLRSTAPANVTLLGKVSTPEVLSHMRRARAFLFAGVEDFGIVMAEAQACGTPVIAFQNGGAVDIVRAGDSSQATGILFSAQTAEAVTDAVKRFERDASLYTSAACRHNALRFDRELFRRRFETFVWDQWERFSRELTQRPQGALTTPK